MKKNIINSLSLLLLTFIFALSSCSYDNEEELYPKEVIIPTDTISYTDDVLPIIVTNCYGCHMSSVVTGGIDLEGYENLIVRVEDGSLLGSIMHEDNYSPMPQGASKLSDSQIEKVSIWIDQDYPNN